MNLNNELIKEIEEYVENYIGFEFIYSLEIANKEILTKAILEFFKLNIHVKDYNKLNQPNLFVFENWKIKISDNDFIFNCECKNKIIENDIFCIIQHIFFNLLEFEKINTNVFWNFYDCWKDLNFDVENLNYDIKKLNDRIDELEELAQK